MADTKLSGLAALAAAPDAGDLFLVVDVSDTSMAASGTDKKITAANVHLGPPDAWPTNVPTLTQSVTVTKTVGRASYVRHGRKITGDVVLNVTGAGTAANNVQIGLPVASTNATNQTIGTGWVYDSSSGLGYSGPLIITGASTAAILICGVGGAFGFFGAIALANADVVGACFCYEAAA